MTWSPANYLQFERERTRPVRDLLQALPDRRVRSAIDLGCGPGNSTECLARAYPDAIVSGLDSSPEMIAAARSRLPEALFEVADISAWQAKESYDLIFSNAALNWVPDHTVLFPRLTGALASNGILAVQLPDNLSEPAQVLMQDTARRARFSSSLACAGLARTAINTASAYHALLKPVCRTVDIWRTTYYHALAGSDAIVDWFISTGLRPFLDPLDAEEKAAYLQEYRLAVCDAYPPAADGTVLLAMPRLFIVACK